MPQLRIAINRPAVARVGLTPGDVISAVRVGLAGQDMSEIWIGQRRFDLVLRLQDESRNDANAIRRMLIDGHDGTRIPLGQLADIEETFGPGALRREAGTRRIALEAGVDGRDLGSTASDIRSRFTKQLQLPPGYFFDVGGKVEGQERAAPCDDSRGVCRKHCCAFAGGRNLERIVARGLDRPFRNRGAKRFGAGYTDACACGRRQAARRGDPRSQHRARSTETHDCCDGDLWIVAHPPAAHARHRNRAPAGHCDDRRISDVDDFHLVGAAHDLSMVCEHWRRTCSVILSGALSRTLTELTQILGKPLVRPVRPEKV
jgi:hypothetical protein